MGVGVGLCPAKRRPASGNLEHLWACTGQVQAPVCVDPGWGGIGPNWNWFCATADCFGADWFDRCAVRPTCRGTCLGRIRPNSVLGELDAAWALFGASPPALGAGGVHKAQAKVAIRATRGADRIDWLECRLKPEEDITCRTYANEIKRTRSGSPTSSSLPGSKLHRHTYEPYFNTHPKHRTPMLEQLHSQARSYG